jgi:predicted HD superfamily hydrolase involved in NAD metabolism
MSLRAQVDQLLDQHERFIIKDHTHAVMAMVTDLGRQFQVNEKDLQTAALLHDISGIIKDRDKVDYCSRYNIPLIEEEITLPVLSHQKISAHMAKSHYHILDEKILSAISCHTTLKVSADDMDKVLFIADKLAWDQDGIPPYYHLVLKALEKSLDYGIYIYMDYVMSNQWLKVVHPDFLKTYLFLKNKFY